MYDLKKKHWTTNARHKIQHSKQSFEQNFSLLHVCNILRAAFELRSKVPSAGLSELLSHVRSASFAFKTSPSFFFFFFGAVIEIKRCTSLDDRLIYGASAALMVALTPAVADRQGRFVIAHSFTAPLNSEASKLVEKRPFWSHDSFHSVVSVKT